jgi:hypothetical protein
LDRNQVVVASWYRTRRISVPITPNPAWIHTRPAIGRSRDRRVPRLEAFYP